jgi:hypothetical protein
MKSVLNSMAQTIFLRTNEMKRKSTTALALAALILPLWIATAPAQLVKVAIGYSGISADQLVIWVAKDSGIFAKNNLDAQTIYFSGGTLSVTAMISGDTPMIQASGPGIVSAGLAGADPIYVVGGITTLDYQLMTQPEIKTAEQLKGGTIAVARFGGAADFVARYALARLGLNPGKDVTIVQTGSTPERMAAMEARRVSGSALVPPSTFVAQKKGFHLLADVAALGLAYQHQGGGHYTKISARTSRCRAQFRQILHRSGASTQNRSGHGNENCRQIFASRRQRIAAQNLRKLHRGEQASSQTVSVRRRSENNLGSAGGERSQGKSGQASGFHRCAFCRRVRQKRLYRQSVRPKEMTAGNCQ